jgi:hypothetical protein
MLCSSSLCSFLQRPTNSSLLGPNILLSNPLSNTFSLSIPKGTLHTEIYLQENSLLCFLANNSYYLLFSSNRDVSTIAFKQQQQQQQQHARKELTICLNICRSRYLTNSTLAVLEQLWQPPSFLNRNFGTIHWRGSYPCLKVAYKECECNKVYAYH